MITPLHRAPKRNAARALIILAGSFLGLALAGCANLSPSAAVAVAPAQTTVSVPVAQNLAGTATPPKSVIYIGNSFMYYNNSLHGHVGQLARAAATNDKERARHSAVSVTISGSGLDWHDVASYFRPDAVARYSFLPNNDVRFNPPGSRLFDAAIMMDCSQCPVHPRLHSVFFEYAKKHSQTVRANGAEPIFMMTWAYADKPEMTQGLADAYGEAARQNNAFVIPVGLAFARSVAAKPELNLYAPDKRHPSLAGTYLAANVVLASVFGVNPIGNSYTAELDAATARHLQELAWQTVQAYKQPAR